MDDKAPGWLVPFELLFVALFAFNLYLTVAFYWDLGGVARLPVPELSVTQIALLDLGYAISTLAVLLFIFSQRRHRSGREA